jgi:fucose 4-O-acetylase-like acetyltransferase
MGTNRRIDFLDIAKGIGIILVVMGHYVPHSTEPRLLFNWIYSFHMPLFFFISGLLFTDKPANRGGYKSFTIRKIRSLIVPYILFSIIQFILNIIEKEPVGIKGALLHGWGTNPLWFIACLFEMELAHYFILNSRKWRYPIIAMLIVLFLYKITYNGWLPYNTSELPYFYSYFLLAYLLRDKFINMEKWKLVVPVFIVLWITHWFILKYALNYNTQYRISDNDLLSFILRYITSMIGLIATLLVSSWISKYSIKVILTWIGRNTLVILCTHMMFYNLLLWMNLPYVSSYPFIYLEIVLLSYVAILIYNKLNPKLLKLLHL